MNQRGRTGSASVGGGGFFFRVYTIDLEGGTTTGFLNERMNFGLFGEFLAQEQQKVSRGPLDDLCMTSR